MIYTEISDSKMQDDLMSDDYAKWTYDQASALVDHYNELYSYTEDLNYSWSPATVRMEWSSYDNTEQVKKAYSLESSEDIEDYTTVLYSEDNTIIIRDF